MLFCEVAILYNALWHNTALFYMYMIFILLNTIRYVAALFHMISILFNILQYLTVLFYVGRRKTRPCPGWVMEEDDVVACILPDDCPPQDGLTIVIIKGFNFQDRLTDQEKQSMIKARFYRHLLLGFFPLLKLFIYSFQCTVWFWNVQSNKFKWHIVWVQEGFA